jgi:hypothetical protein
VFFCSDSSLPLEFREPVESDYLNSYLRRYVFTGLVDREIDTNVLHQGNVTSPAEERAKWILTDKHSPLGKWQDQVAVEHWKCMSWCSSSSRCVANHGVLISDARSIPCPCLGELLILHIQESKCTSSVGIV